MGAPALSFLLISENRIPRRTFLGSSVNKQLRPGTIPVTIIRNEIFPPWLSLGLLCSC